MYTLAVGAMFKNEQHILREWMDHYIFHGVEHFYMINDGSTDNSMEVLQPYIDRGLVTLWYATQSQYLGRQRDAYNTYIYPRLNEMKWLLMVDLDEFMWSQDSVDLREVLKKCNHLAQVQVHDRLFGSNGHEHQPASVVQGFTKRTAIEANPKGVLKYFINTDYKFTHLNVHHATHVHMEDQTLRFLKIGAPHFILNHYNCQSRALWNMVKCTRGDIDNYRVRTDADFTAIDLNDVDDYGLAQQNTAISPR